MLNAELMRVAALALLTGLCDLCVSSEGMKRGVRFVTGLLLIGQVLQWVKSLSGAWLAGG